MSDHSTNISGTLNRRDALAAIGLAAGSATLAGAGCAAPGTAQSTSSPSGTVSPAMGMLGPDQLGYDPDTGRYTVPPLPYAYDALEPAIDEQTMRIHHDRHHAGYVRGLNRAIDQLQALRGSEDSSLIKHWSRELSFHGSGHVNHTLFWLGMAPQGEGGGGEPGGPLAQAITRDFGSFGKFAWQFKAAAGAVEGSGWAWLVLDPIASRLLVIQGEKQQNLMMTGVVPLLGVDVWEHAYYLKYQNRRGDYLDAFMRVINWPHVARLYERAIG